MATKHHPGVQFLSKKRLTIYGYRTMHRWTLWGENGKMIDSSNEDFYNMDDCINNFVIVAEKAISEVKRIGLKRNY